MMRIIYTDETAQQKPDIDDMIYGSADPVPSER